jgi:hypothetical protein
MTLVDLAELIPLLSHKEDCNISVGKHENVRRRWRWKDDVKADLKGMKCTGF